MLQCPQGCTSLLQSEYAEQLFRPDALYQGLARYHRWLPGLPEAIEAGEPAILPGGALGHELGIERLWLALSGDAPQHGATLTAGSFKALEAGAVLARLAEAEGAPILTLASAGNTAVAFAEACSTQRRACVIVIPERVQREMRLATPVAPWVVIVTLRDASYDDAIGYAQRIAEQPGFVLEGGVRNIARRDGLGSVLLFATERIGRIPDLYVQAVGSGAGALGALTMAERLRTDGRFGTHRLRLALVQNAPFMPLVRSWQAQSPTLITDPPSEARAHVAAIAAQVLSNMAPPYAITGGVYDALRTSNGVMCAVDNDAIAAASARLQQHLNIIPDPAAAAALAGLKSLLASGSVSPDTEILLHLTGATPVSAMREHHFPTTIAAMPGEEAAPFAERIVEIRRHLEQALR